jgi:Arc/MetJ-type ribon-helix-helix transcriptional regulator
MRQRVVKTLTVDSTKPPTAMAGHTNDIPWYVFGMTTKIAISLPDEQVQALRRSVEAGKAASVSGLISEAIARMEREDSLRALLDDLDRELGEPSPDAYAWADKALGLA